MEDQTPAAPSAPPAPTGAGTQAAAVTTPPPATPATPPAAPATPGSPGTPAALGDGNTITPAQLREQLGAAYNAGRADERKGRRPATPAPAPSGTQAGQQATGAPATGTQAAPAPGTQAGQQATEGPGTGKQPAGEGSLLEQELRQRLEALEAERAAERQHVAMMAEAAKRTTAQGQVAAAITQHLGINPALAGPLAKVWLDEGKVRYDDTGVYFVEAPPPAPGAPPKLAPISAGLAAYARTEEGRKLMPLVPAGPGLAGGNTPYMGSGTDVSQLPRGVRMRLALNADTGRR